MQTCYGFIYFKVSEKKPATEWKRNVCIGRAGNVNDCNRIKRARKSEMNDRTEVNKNGCCGIWVAIKLSFGRVTFARKFNEHTHTHLKSRTKEISCVENKSEAFKLAVQIVWTKTNQSKWVYRYGVDVFGECESQQMLTLIVLKLGLVPSCCILPYRVKSKSTKWRQS